MEKSIFHNNQLNTSADHTINSENNSMCSLFEKSEIDNINNEDNVTKTLDCDSNTKENLDNINSRNINNADEVKPTEVNKEYDYNSTKELQNPIINNINTEDTVKDTEANAINESCVEVTCPNLHDTNNNEEDVLNGSETVNINENIDNNSNSDIQNSVNNINNEAVVKPIEAINTNKEYGNNASTDLQNPFINDINSADNVKETENIKQNVSWVEVTCPNLDDTNNNEDVVTGSKTININENIDNNLNSDMQHSVNYINNETNVKATVTINLAEDYDNNTTSGNNTNEKDSLKILYTNTNDNHSIRLSLMHDDISSISSAHGSLKFNSSELEKECPSRALCDLISLRQESSSSDIDSEISKLSSVKNPSDLEITKHFAKTKMNISESSGKNRLITKNQNSNCSCYSADNKDVQNLIKFENKGITLCYCKLSITEIMEKLTKLLDKKKNINTNRKSDEIISKSNNHKILSDSQNSNLSNEFRENLKNIKTSFKMFHSSRKCTVPPNLGPISNNNNNVVQIKSVPIKCLQLISKATQTSSVIDPVIISACDANSSNKEFSNTHSLKNNVNNNNEILENCEDHQLKSIATRLILKLISVATQISNDHISEIKSNASATTTSNSDNSEDFHSLNSQNCKNIDEISSTSVIERVSIENYKYKQLKSVETQVSIDNDQKLISKATQISNETIYETSASTTSNISVNDVEILSIIKQVLIESDNDQQLKSVVKQFALKLLSVATQILNSNIFELKYHGSNITTSNSDDNKDFYSLNSQNCQNIDEISSASVADRVSIENYNNHRLKLITTQSIDQKLISIATQISYNNISETSSIFKSDGEILSIIKHVLIENDDDDNQLKSIATQLILKLISVATQISNDHISEIKSNASVTTTSNSDNSEDFHSLNSQNCKNIDEISSTSVIERVSIENYKYKQLKSVETQVSIDKYIMYVANEILKLNDKINERNSDDVTMSQKETKNIRKISSDEISKSNYVSTQQCTDDYPALLSSAKDIFSISDNINLKSNEKQSTEHLNVEQQIISDEKTINNTKETQLTVRNSLTEKDDINNNQIIIEKTSSNLVDGNGADDDDNDNIDIIYQTPLKPPTNRISLQLDAVQPKAIAEELPIDETSLPLYNLHSSESFYNILNSNEALQFSTEFLHNIIEYLKLESLEKLQLNEKQKKLNMDKNFTEISSSQKNISLNTAMNAVSVTHQLETSPAVQSVDSVNTTISQLENARVGSSDTINTNTITTTIDDKCVLCYRLEQQILETNDIELIKYVFQKLPDCTCKNNINDLQTDIEKINYEFDVKNYVNDNNDEMVNIY